MSDDDGLMLNFAAAPARPPAKRLNGQRRNERQQRNAVRNTVDESKRSTVAPPVTLPPTTNAASKRKEEDITHAKTAGKGPLPSTSSAASAKGTPSTSTQGRAVPAPPGRNGYISSLFTGDEASTSRKPISTRVTEETQHLPTNAPSSGTPFGSLGLDPLLVHHLQAPKMGIKIPTSIQRNALPFLLSPTNIGRDALIHAQTGSGKTFSYVLPIIQSLLPLCETSWIDRQCLGTLAIILAPTRELAHQIYEVAEKLCSLHLTSQGAAKPDSTQGDDEGGEDKEAVDAIEGDRGTRRTRWIIPGLLSGGATRNHEKSRLRKGLPLIVATPGRLLDHLRNTGSLDVGRLQWLVLDEADRLLQLGFEQTLTDIMKAIDGRRRSTCEAQRMRMVQELGTQAPQDQSRIPDEEVVDSFGEMWWKTSRRTILCSATLDEGVQVLAGKSLINPRVIRGDGEDASSDATKAEEEKGRAGQARSEKTTMLAAPAQLKQKYAVVPTKQRLIVLIALLRQAVAAGRSKIMVFLSCTDSVDFHWAALGGVRMAQGGEEAQTESDGKGSDALCKESELLPSTSVFKLHGSLSQRDRQTSLKLFSQCTASAVLLCTSVASRGLDLDVSLVVQLDPPSEKGVDEYLHRIGRTARVGEDGESWIMLLPSEEGCIPYYEGQMGATARKIEQRQANEIITNGFTSSQDLWQAQGRATEVQLAFERWVLQTDDHAGLARKAYLSHLRAYTTHPPSERQYFSINNLQLGHLAKAFALREAPGEIRAKVKASNKKNAAKSAAQIVGTEQPGNKQKRKRSGGADGLDGQGDGEVNDDDDDDEEEDITKKSLDFARNKETEAKMYAKVRQMGKLNRRGGVLGSYGIDEYQIG